MKLNLGCGQTVVEGFTGVDIAKVPGVDVVHDLMKFPWPFEAESVDEILCSHFIEHIPHRAFGDVGPDPFFLFFDEVYRVLKPAATGKFIAPYYSSMRSWQDPQHCRAISDATALYLNKAWRKLNRLDHYPIACDFDFVIAYDVSPNWASRAQEAKDFAFVHYCNVIADIHIIVTKRAATP